MPECRKKVSTASVFLLVFNWLSPASPFRHQSQFVYRWPRISPALTSYANLPALPYSNPNAVHLSYHTPYKIHRLFRKKPPCTSVFSKHKAAEQKPLSNALSSLSLITLLLGARKIFSPIQPPAFLIYGIQLNSSKAKTIKLCKDRFKFSPLCQLKLTSIGAVQFYNSFNYLAEITATWQCLS